MYEQRGRPLDGSGLDGWKAIQKLQGRPVISPVASAVHSASSETDRYVCKFEAGKWIIVKNGTAARDLPPLSPNGAGFWRTMDGSVVWDGGLSLLKAASFFQPSFNSGDSIEPKLLPGMQQKDTVPRLPKSESSSSASDDSAEANSQQDRP